MIHRRKFLASSTAAVLAGPTLSYAQARPARIAMVSQARTLAEMREGGTYFFDAFFKEMRRSGYVEGQNLTVERFTAMGNAARYPDVARELAASTVDIIVLAGSSMIGTHLVGLAKTTPIVHAGTGTSWFDTVVTSYARPGGNITGTTTDYSSGQIGQVDAKLLEWLVAAVPSANPIGYLIWPRVLNGDAITPARAPVMTAAAAKLGVRLAPGLVEDPIDEPAYRRALASLADARVEAICVAYGTTNHINAGLISAVALERKWPVIGGTTTYTDNGCLLSYGANVAEMYRVGASYVVRILRGEAPGNLPVHQPEAYDLAINLKTARAIGVTIPASVLATAVQVIE